MNELSLKVKNAMLSMQRYPWEQGVAAQSMYEAGDTDTFIMMARDAVLRQTDDGRLAVVSNNIACTDPAANGEAVWRAYEHTGDEYFKHGAERMLEYLMMYAPRTPDGVIFHNNVSFHEGFTPDQIWADACYMMPPFLAVMGEFTEATKQFGGYYNILADDKTGLLYHIYDYGSNRFIRKKLWATGNGWALLGTARLLSEAVKHNEVETAHDLSAAGTAMLDGMLKFQSKDGRFHDILNDPKTFLDGTSAMMVAAFIYRGICEGWLEDGYREYADKVRKTMPKHIDGFGLIHGVCGAPDFLSEGTSAEAQAAFIMMEAWAEKLI